MPTRYKVLSTKYSAFTLIELLVVISIIGILAVLVSANLNSARSRARDTQRKSDLKNTQTALRLYFNDMAVYPGNNSGGEIMGCVAGTSLCEWGKEFSVGSTIYMAKLPKDPLASQTYQYELGPAGDTIILTACLENASDAQGVTTVSTSYDGLCSVSHWMFQIQ